MEIKTLIDSFVDIRSMMTNLFGYIFVDGALENTSVDNIEEESFVEKEDWYNDVWYFSRRKSSWKIRLFNSSITYQISPYTTKIIIYYIITLL